MRHNARRRDVGSADGGHGERRIADTMRISRKLHVTYLAVTETPIYESAGANAILYLVPKRSVEMGRDTVATVTRTTTRGFAYTACKDRFDITHA